MPNWAVKFAASLACSLAWLCMVTPASAGPALLFDADNGKVLYSEQPDSHWYPASLTKVMTAYIAFEAIESGQIKLDDKIPCSLVATLQPPSKVGLHVGAQLSVEQALKAVIIKSANDVTVMLAEYIAGNETAFVARMNETAKRLGMARTHFVNTNGLPEPDQVTTARDLATLTRAIIKRFPQYASYWAQPDMRIGKKRLASHNALLKTYAGADGLKTGFTCDSGFNVIATATRDGHRLVAIVLGEPSGQERTIRAASLLEHGFQNYGWKELFSNSSLDSMPMDPAAKPVTSVRESVVAWDCGNGKRKKKKTVAQRNLERKAVAKAKANANAQAKVTDTSISANPEEAERTVNVLQFKGAVGGPDQPAGKLPQFMGIAPPAMTGGASTSP